MAFDSIFNYYMPLVGAYAGKPYDVYRPVYGTANLTPPALVSTGIMYRVDPTTGKFAEPRIEGGMYYDIFGPTSNLISGDLLIRSTAVLNASGVPNTPDIMYPPVTVISYDLLKSTVGIRTARIGRIQDSVADPNGVIYTPVYFDWLGQGFPGSQINKNLAESLKIPSQRAVIYTRTNVTRLRSHLIETDLGVLIPQEDGTFIPYERSWIIDEIDQSGPLMMLTLRNV